MSDNNDDDESSCFSFLFFFVIKAAIVGYIFIWRKVKRAPDNSHPDGLLFVQHLQLVSIKLSSL